FSSRRRHTRLSRDWSSDVCSSDLGIEPETPEGVIHQKLDHIARREELVAYCQLAAVAWCLTGIAHRLALFLGVEVLVDPADGFRSEERRVGKGRRRK